METKNKIICTLKRAISLALAFAIAMSLSSPLNAEAKIKTINLKSQGNTIYASKANKAATTVKKGTYKVVVKASKKGEYTGYVKFVAPKTKKYSITVSDVKGQTDEYVCGSVHTQSPIEGWKSRISSVLVSSKGEKTSFIEVANHKDSPDSYYIPSRTATIKMKKGQVLYLGFDFTPRDDSKSISSKLVIK